MVLTLTDDNQFLRIDEIEELELEQITISLTKRIESWRFNPLVKKGGIVAFHDTVYSSGYNEDVPKFIRDLKNGKFTDGKQIPIKDIVESETQGISYFIK